MPLLTGVYFVLRRLAQTDRYPSRNFLHRDTLLAASAVYQGAVRFSGLEAVQSVRLTEDPKALHGHEDGTIPATFQVIFMVCTPPFLACVRA